MPTFTLIQTVTVSSPTSNIAISSIPATYTDLVVIGSYRGDVAGTNSQGNIQFNGDTSATYSFARAVGDSSGANGTGNTSVSSIRVAYVGPGSTGTANSFGTFVYYIFNYRSNYTKFIQGQDLRLSSSSTGDCYVQMQTAQWRNTGTINQITFFSAQAHNLAAGCTFSLYGIKNS
jgi:ribosomal protein S11